MAAASVSGAARRVLAMLVAGEARLGGGRLLAIDGPSGSGKTTLAEEVMAAVADVAPALAPVRVVHTDELLDGWRGLPGLGVRLDPLLTPLARGETGRYRRYDWHAGEFAEEVEVAPTPLLVLEGVGAGLRRHAHLVTTLVWVDAPEEVRIARTLARDGADLAAHLPQWRADEQHHFAEEHTRARADTVIHTPT
ncbi:uridine kinase family protein [Nocardioides pacificus]